VQAPTARFGHDHRNALLNLENKMDKNYRIRHPGLDIKREQNKKQLTELEWLLFSTRVVLGNYVLGNYCKPQAVVVCTSAHFAS
jgi:hypothetical protein